MSNENVNTEVFELEDFIAKATLSLENRIRRANELETTSTSAIQGKLYSFRSNGYVVIIELRTDKEGNRYPVITHSCKDWEYRFRTSFCKHIIASMMLLPKEVY